VIAMTRSELLCMRCGAVFMNGSCHSSWGVLCGTTVLLHSTRKEMDAKSWHVTTSIYLYTVTNRAWAYSTPRRVLLTSTLLERVIAPLKLHWQITSQYVRGLVRALDQVISFFFFHGCTIERKRDAICPSYGHY
jgi:hypothetical protein